jgi:uncharacterized protein YlxW (UPF0749 family)
MSIAIELKRNKWIWQITLLSVVLGMLLAAALKTQQNIKRVSGIPTTRASGLAQALLDEKDRNKGLRNEITDLRAKVDGYEQALGEGTTRTGVLSEELQKAKFLAGLTPAEGSGVEVTLLDSPKNPPADPELRQEYIIHDLDLRNFVNELLANGAETVAISDLDGTQRIISKTPIRCVSGVIRVNDVPMAAPFIIHAIGPPHNLESALRLPGGIIDQFRIIEGLARDMVKVKRRDHVVIPAYSGSTSFIYTSMPSAEGKRK